MIRRRYSIQVPLISGALLAAGCLGLPGNSEAEWVGAADRDLVLPPGITQIKTLKQNWSDGVAERFYSTPQGSELLPYSWFVNLEQAENTNSFLTPDHIRKIGYLARKPNTEHNPDGLPLGFVKDGEHVGMTCAACHSGQIQSNGTLWLIDGAPTMADATLLLVDLVNALDATLADSAKFLRFSTAVLGANSTPEQQAQLRTAVAAELAVRRAYNDRNLPHAGAPTFGPGRLDAFGAIMNEVAVRFAQVPDNETMVNAPVSYPMLWDTPQHDKVQWNGSVPNTIDPTAKLLLGTEHVGALGRNAGEVIGVFGRVDTSVDPGKFGGYPSSIRAKNLIELEEMLRTLWSPLWPAELGPIDPLLRGQGQILFEMDCRSCHKEIDRSAADRKILAQLKDVGTDSTMARNAAQRTARSGVLAGRTTLSGLLKKPKTIPEVAPISDLLEHLGQRSLLTSSKIFNALNRVDVLNVDIEATIRSKGSVAIDGVFSRFEFDGKKLTAEARRLFRHDPRQEGSGELTSAALEQMSAEDSIQFTSSADRPDEIQLTSEAADTRVEFKYKARPLNGIWASAPYLHNGSVPNLDELLKPPAERRGFQVGSLEFDAVKVGYVSDRGGVLFDPTLPGNSNQGHDYGRVYTEAERRALIEYMKSL